MRSRRIVAVVAVVMLLACGGLFAFWQALDHGMVLAIPHASACVVRNGTSAEVDGVTLVPDRMANAATIAAVGLRQGVPRQAVVIALATALQESKLDNISGGDRDSVGLFQQRPSQGWGTVEQIADPRYAAKAFYSALLKVQGWQNMRVTDAAQAVQKSAYPEAYQRWNDNAVVLAAALSGDTTGAVACTLSGDPVLNGASATASLTAGFRLDWGEIRTTTAADLLGVALNARDVRTGWQYAHWMVAHAQQNGVTRVRFADQVWTASQGSWTRASTAAQVGNGRVLAEVQSGS